MNMSGETFSELQAPSIDEETHRVLGALGLVWADTDDIPIIPEHPEDERWIVRSEN